MEWDLEISPLSDRLIYYLLSHRIRASPMKDWKLPLFGVRLLFSGVDFRIAQCRRHKCIKQSAISMRVHFRPANSAEQHARPSKYFQEHRLDTGTCFAYSVKTSSAGFPQENPSGRDFTGDDSSEVTTHSSSFG